MRHSTTLKSPESRPVLNADDVEHWREEMFQKIREKVGQCIAVHQEKMSELIEWIDMEKNTVGLNAQSRALYMPSKKEMITISSATIEHQRIIALSRLFMMVNAAIEGRREHPHGSSVMEKKSEHQTHHVDHIAVRKTRRPTKSKKSIYAPKMYHAAISSRR